MSLQKKRVDLDNEPIVYYAPMLTHDNKTVKYLPTKTSLVGTVINIFANSSKGLLSSLMVGFVALMLGVVLDTNIPGMVLLTAPYAVVFGLNISREFSNRKHYKSIIYKPFETVRKLRHMDKKDEGVLNASGPVPFLLSDAPRIGKYAPKYDIATMPLSKSIVENRETLGEGMSGDNYVINYRTGKLSTPTHFLEEFIIAKNGHQHTKIVWSESPLYTWKQLFSDASGIESRDSPDEKKKPKTKKEKTQTKKQGTGKNKDKSKAKGKDKTKGKRKVKDE